MFKRAQPNTGWGMTETNAIGTGIIGSDYLELSITRLSLEEDFPSEISTVVVDAIDTRGNTTSVDGRGVGLVDPLIPQAG